MSKTPHCIGEKVDKVIDGLNATWDLRLPRFNDSDSSLVANEKTSRSSRCSSRIRFLCYQSNITIDNVIEEFEEEAKVIFSKWIWKPLQERGTIPSLPSSNSSLTSDIVGRRLQPITGEMRYSLVEKLSNILDDEYNLVRDSEDYQRVSSQASQHTTSTDGSFKTATSKSSQLQTKPVDRSSVGSLPNKRRQTSQEASYGKRAKFLPQSEIPRASPPKIDHFFKISKSAIPIDPGSSSIAVSATGAPKHNTSNATSYKHVQEVATSFETVTSSGPSVFSPPNNQSHSSSSQTSFLLETEASQDYFPTQEAKDCLADESFVSILDDADVLPVMQTLTLGGLNVSTPFQRAQPLTGDLLFWMRWEIYRIAQKTELSPHFIEKSIRRQHDITRITYDIFWSSARAICAVDNKAMPPKSDIRSWMEGANSYMASNGNTAYFTFNLVYNQSPAPSLWTLELNPIKVDIGNRIHRKFGADRHVTGFLSYFDKGDLPKWVTKDKAFNAGDAFKNIVTWLATETHHIAGREWRAFYLEPEKRRLNGEAPRQKMSLFAIDGEDFSPLNRKSGSLRPAQSIYEFIDWHIPLTANIKSTNLKLFSRFGLGLSKTKATVTLQPSQFRYLPDKKPVMNDGCALISIGMAKAVWQICGDGSKDVPSAFQARCAGAKGLWVPDYRDSEAKDETDLWIEISESQLKIEPHPCQDFSSDETQRTFEVLKWSSPCKPGHLNIQLINILVDRGVPRSILKQIVLNDIEDYIQASREAMKDARQLQAWLQDYHVTDRNLKPISFADGLPEIKEEEVRFLSQCGFTAENCQHLREGIMSLMMQRLNTYVEKLRIEVPYSTSAFCVPDPYQVLEEDEVYLGFSTLWENPKTGLKETALDDIDILVARNPAALASDIQKRKAVYKHELRHFKDVIVFPTKGEVPLASLLSGGDYDGDTVTVIWDPNLVKDFCNMEKPRLPSEEQCGLQKVSVKLTDAMSASPSHKDIDKFIESCIFFNAQSSRLGMCTNEHERLLYSGVKLSDPGAILLAALAGYLVDANKQGLAQTEASWHQVRKTAQAGRRLFPLAYKTGDDCPYRRDDGDCVNIIDHLKFDVAMKRKDDIHIEFENMLVDAQNYDQELSVPYKRANRQAMDQADLESEATRAILSDLKHELEKVMETWRIKASKRENDPDRGSLSTVIHQISGMIRDIKPLNRNCDIYRGYVDHLKYMVEGKHSNLEAGLWKGSQWSLLRASTMYHMFPKRKITWWAVGDELGRIKARSSGPTRELPLAIHHVLKPDSKLIKRLAAEIVENHDEDAAE